MTDIAIAHKDYLVRGGGERLVETMAGELEVPLYYGGAHGDVEIGYDDAREVQATGRQRWCINRGGVLRALAYNAVWQNEDRLTEYDTVITSGNEPLWYVAEPDQTHIAYCHSPPRTMYDLNHNTGRGMIGALIRSIKRTWFQHNIARPDIWIANSEHVKRRMERYWGLRHRDINVVYPPIETESLSPNHADTGGYYLYLGRLAGHKRVDLAIEAVNSLNDVELKVAGRGGEYDALESQAGGRVEMLGYVSEKRKRELYAGAKALIMPAQAEDFGMVPVEAMASGTPVIGVDEGFTKHQINDGKNGLLCEGTTGGIYGAIDRFERYGVEWSAEQIAEHAEQYNTQRFKREIQDIVYGATDD